MKYDIYQRDCISGSKKLFESNSVDLMVCDPPFGINEAGFGKHYKRNTDNVVNGYVEAPNDYYKFTYEWLKEAKRILKDNGVLYLISGWSNLRDVLNALHDTEFTIINHIIWKFNFGVYTKNKFVTSHYHIIYAMKNSNMKCNFNRFCRFGPSEKDSNSKSLNYIDTQDVWKINKEYHSNKKKNKNKLPDELIRKIILYSSNENDIVCDFFMGNFTTAYVAIQLGRTPIGFELNKNIYAYHIKKLEEVVYGNELKTLRKIDVIVPKNQGKRITPMERRSILNDFYILNEYESMSKKDSMAILCKRHGRGKFSIINIIDADKK